MSLSFLSRNRTVLLISDEALFVYDTSASGVELVDKYDWDDPAFEGNAVDAISKKCGGKPVLILNDMVEQHYRKEKVIKVGAFIGDKSTMIRRKLNVAFPTYPVRAAFPLKEKIKKAEGQLPADVYIFAAVPNSTQFNQTMSVASKSLASVAGFCLLPVESSDMLKTLSEKLSKDKRGNASKWCVFIGQHKNGGLRQIVTKDGEIALTRMTPVCNIDEGVQKWAAEVHQEYKSTMSYLARFGYVPEDTLESIVISNSEAGDILNTLVSETETNFHTMTVQEASQLLNLKIGRQQDSHYADPLHVAWSGKKSKFLLPMKASQVDEVVRPRQIATAASLLLFGSALFFGYQAMTSIQSFASVSSDLNRENDKKTQLEAQYKREVEKKEALGFNVRLVQASIRVKEKLDNDNIEVIDLFSAIGYSLGRDLRIDRVIVEPIEENIVQARFDQFVSNNDQKEKQEPLYSVRLQMTYPSTTDVERGNREVESLNTRIAQALPGFEVNVTKLLKDYEYTEGLIVNTGDLNNQANVDQDFLAEITVKGPMRVKDE